MTLRIGEMTSKDCPKILAGNRIKRLGCSSDNQPYVLPIYFVYEPDHLYGFATFGQKIEWMRSGKTPDEKLNRGTWAEAIAQLLQTLVAGEVRVLSQLTEIDVVGHRVVNGGREITRPTLISPEVAAAIEKLSVFAPLHNRAELQGIALIEKQCGHVPQVAVFDTGFHSSLPEAAAVYPGPYVSVQQGIRKFGFHGINHQYCAERAAQLLERNLATLNLVTCDLGNGWRHAAL